MKACDFLGTYLCALIESLKETSEPHYHIASAVLKELVDRDLGFITMLILKNSFSITRSQMSVVLKKLILKVLHFEVFLKILCFLTPSKSVLCKNPGCGGRILTCCNSFLFHAEFTLARCCSEMTVLFSSVLYCPGRN